MDNDLEDRIQQLEFQYSELASRVSNLEDLEKQVAEFVEYLRSQGIELER